MPNPSRPNFGDVIDETWGRLTADRIIRRYASFVERDLDVAGISGADLAGQQCMIISPGQNPYPMVHDGVGWTIPLVVGHRAGLGDANGYLDANWPIPFRVAPEVLIASNDRGGSSGGRAIFIDVTGTSIFGFTTRTFTSNGAPNGNGYTAYTYLAVARTGGALWLEERDEGLELERAPELEAIEARWRELEAAGAELAAEVAGPPPVT